MAAHWSGVMEVDSRDGIVVSVNPRQYAVPAEPRTPCWEPRDDSVHGSCCFIRKWPDPVSHPGQKRRRGTREACKARLRRPYKAVRLLRAIEGEVGSSVRRVRVPIPEHLICRHRSALGGSCVLQARGRGWKLLDLP